MSKFWLHVRPNDSNIPIHVHCEFPGDEWSRLSRFAEFAGQLSQTRVRKDGGLLEFTVITTAEGQIEIQGKLPSPDDADAFLHRMRPFVLKHKEPTYLPHICNTIARRMNDPRIRARLDRQKKLFDGERMRSMVTIKSNEVVLNSEQMLMKWLNAFEYHRDEDKRNEVEALHWLWPTEGSRALFLALMLDKADAVSYVHWLIGTLHQGPACDEPTCPSST